MYHDLIVILLLAVAVPVIALVAFKSVAKTKRRRRPVKNFR
jgi:Tfp pilus assembly protein PilX